MRSILIILIGFALLSSCHRELDVASLKAKGGRKYGGEFRFMSSEKINSLACISSVDEYSSRVISQIYDPLFDLDLNTLELKPSIAESFFVNDDATVYTFKIKTGILFHKNDCFNGKTHELTAEDVKFSLEMACSNLKINRIGHLLVNRIKGAKSFFEKSSKVLPKEGVSGIKVINSNEIQITLTKSFSQFEKLLSHSGLGIFPKEAWMKYGLKMGDHPVGTGPFEFESKNDAQIVLKRNNQYWKKDAFDNQLPFLAKIIVNYSNNKKDEFLSFRKEENDLVLKIPVEEVKNTLGTLIEAQDGKNIKHRIESQSSLNTHYIAFNNESGVFKNVDVRKAFNLVLDREDLINNVMGGDGRASLNGFVPEMLNYPINNVKGHSYDVSRAKQLMASAGYANGHNFPEIELYVVANEGAKPHVICEAIVKSLNKNLALNLSVKICSVEERDRAIYNKEAKMWMDGWLADYTDPETFLNLLYSKNKVNRKSYANHVYFNNSEFDHLFEQAVSELDKQKRCSLFVQCDQRTVDYAPVMPIYTSEHTIMLNARVRGFQLNEMEVLNLTEVFIKEVKKN